MSLDKLFSKEIDRRDFLKKSGQAALAVGGALTLDALLSSCATMSFKEEPPIAYPRVGKPGQNKVQPPKDGCHIGFFGVDINKAEELIGVKARIEIFSENIVGLEFGFPKTFAENISSQGGIPFIYRTLDLDIAFHGFKNLVDTKEFTQDLTQYAKDVVKYGKPLFISTMRELNGNWFPWGQQSKTAKKVWRHMWQIFEDNGANQYATWVLEVDCPEGAGGASDYPERYYPGDKYVDWIGLSAYARTCFPFSDRSFKYLNSRTYSQMESNHPNKPIIQVEFGKTSDRRQPKWLREAYATIKSWSGMKAAIYWNVYDPTVNDYSSLSRESMEVLKEVFLDDYFIGAK